MSSHNNRNNNGLDDVKPLLYTNEVVVVYGTEEEKFSNDQRHSGGSQQASKKTVCCNRLTKVQCALLTTSVLILTGAVLVILWFLAVIPYAQHKLDASQMQILSMKLSNPTENSFQMQIQTVLTGTNELPAGIIDSAQLAVTYQGLPFAHFDFPASPVNTSSNVTLLEFESQFVVFNFPVFSQFIHATWLNATADIGIVSKVRFSVFGPRKQHLVASLPLELNKSLMLKGLNGLNNSNTTNFVPRSGYDLTADPPRTFGSLNIEFNNTASFELPTLGNLTFNVFSNGTNIGTATVIDAAVLPGYNNFNVSLVNYLTADTTPLLGALLVNYNNNVSTPLLMKFLNGTVPLLADAFQGVEFTLNLK